MKNYKLPTKKKTHQKISIPKTEICIEHPSTKPMQLSPKPLQKISVDFQDFFTKLSCNHQNEEWNNQNIKFGWSVFFRKRMDLWESSQFGSKSMSFRQSMVTTDEDFPSQQFKQSQEPIFFNNSPLYSQNLPQDKWVQYSAQNKYSQADYSFTIFLNSHWKKL